MSSVALYRTLIPDAEHAALDDAVVSTYLDLAARRHSAAAFGTVYPEAMVYYAAHCIQRTPGLIAGGSGADEVGPVTSQKDGDLSRTYGTTGGGSGATGAVGDGDLGLTAYGLRYLELRGSRASSAPFGVLFT